MGWEEKHKKSHQKMWQLTMYSMQLKAARARRYATAHVECFGGPGTSAS